ncbi:hypothetical protein EZV62_004125 [Acer yangbiense]|uniref:RNase H type-1 domain-containing protein n=1 Tax=Acer yangbiense TaxID=1000413 RepID=A0A5C7IIT4_9ROSI|nr:hypothetical protein EZV62_004125 [Acer yangbiense]
MDPDEIARLYASLSIKGKEERVRSVQDTLKNSAGKKLDLCLVGKILSHKRVNRDAFRAVMPRIWQTCMDIEVVNDNTFLFYFRNHGDRFRILAGGPWCFDNSLLVLERLSRVGDINDSQFNKVDFWIQIPNAPLLFTGECFGRYMRLRVTIDVSKPLKREMNMEFEFGSWLRAMNPPGQNRGGFSSRGQGDAPGFSSPGLKKNSVTHRDQPRVQDVALGGEDVNPVVVESVVQRNIPVEESVEGLVSVNVGIMDQGKNNGVGVVLVVCESLHGNYGDVHALLKKPGGCEVDSGGMCVMTDLNDHQNGHQNVQPRVLGDSRGEAGVVLKKGKWKRWAREGGIRKKGPVEENFSLKKRVGEVFESDPSFGLGGDRAFRVLHSLLQVNHPDIVFLIEIICVHKAMESVRIKLGFDAKLVVDRKGHSGGLCLLWKAEIDVALLSYSRFHIDTVVTLRNDKVWRLTGFYGHPNLTQRIHGWNLLRRLAGMSPLPWFVGGDFNEIVGLSEKVGGNTRHECFMGNFQEALEDCGLRDLGFLGPRFTWSNRRDSEHAIQERLDRCVGNTGWLDLFSCFSIKHLDFWKSDHRPILLEISDKKEEAGGRHRFYYDRCWAERDDFVRLDFSQLPFIDFVLFCKGKLDIMYFEFLCVVWWRVWYRRNQLVYEKSSQTVHDFDVLDWAASFIQDFKAAKTVDTGSVVKQRVAPKWKPSPSGSYKINTDATLDCRAKVTGIGVVIRDCYGHVMASLCQSFPGLLQPQTVEAVAVLRGFRLALEAGLCPASIESDSLSVVNLINSMDILRAEIGVVLHDILAMGSNSFFSSVSFVPRLTNCVAHSLAKLSLSFEGEHVWLEDCPLAVESLVLGDCPSSL